MYCPICGVKGTIKGEVKNELIDFLISWEKYLDNKIQRKEKHQLKIYGKINNKIVIVDYGN